MNESKQKIEISSELYVNTQGQLIETETHQEVIGVCLAISEDSTEAWFQYIINDEYAS